VSNKAIKTEYLHRIDENNDQESIEHDQESSFLEKSDGCNEIDILTDQTASIGVRISHLFLRKYIETSFAVVTWIYF
jgi:hypothetical protein